MTKPPKELLLGTDKSPLGRLYRWLTFAGALALAVSMGLGYLALLIAPFGALLTFVGLVLGTRWLDQQPRLRAVSGADFVLLTLAVSGTFAAAYSLLHMPDWYWVYWAGLAILLLNATLFVRRRARRGALLGILSTALFVAPMLCVRSSAIAQAVETASANHVQLFLWFGADVNQRKQHYPLLVIAIRTQDLRTTRLLLDHGADPNVRTGAFMASTPALSEAAATGNAALVRLLLEHGAAPNLSNSWGETALARAARMGRVDAVRLLLGRGADPRQTDRDGRRPADVARAAHHYDLERLLAP